jgi:hypothetical protein
MADKRQEYLEAQKLRIARDALRLEEKKYIRDTYALFVPHWRAIIAARVAHILAFVSGIVGLLGVYWLLLFKATSSTVFIYKFALALILPNRRQS